MTKPKSISFEDAAHYANLCLWDDPSNGLLKAWAKEVSLRRATWKMMLELNNRADAVIESITASGIEGEPVTSDSITWTYLGNGDWTSGSVRNFSEPMRGEYHASHHDPKGEACTLTFPDGETFTGTSRECRNRAEAHMNGETE